MIIGQKGIKYGLQQANVRRQAAPVQPKLSVFGDLSDGEEDVGTQVARHAAAKATDSRVAASVAAAEAEIEGIFDYDSFLDSSQAQQAQRKKAEPMLKRSRYIAQLKDKAEERKKEESIIFDRRKKKEQEVEAHLFGDKPVYVTNAYRKHQEEQAKYEAELDKRDAKDSANAAEKRGNMAAFYSNLLTKNVAYAGSRASDEVVRPAAVPALEAPQSRTEQPTAADGQESPAQAAAPKSNWEAAELARKAAASKPSRAPADEAAELPSQQERVSPAEPSARSIADTRGIGASTAIETPQRPQGERPERDCSAPAEEAQAAAAQQAAAVRRNDEDRVAAARERFLARKRKVGDA